MRWIILVLLSFFFGIFGGIFADQILWPYFVEKPLFYKYKIEKAPIYVIERKEIKIQENKALKEAIEEVEESVFFIKTKMGKKTIEGSGFVLTSDGLAVSLASLVPSGGNFVFLANGEILPFEILKRDKKENLVLIKFEKENLMTRGFFDFEKLNLGERVFLLAKVSKKGKIENIVAQGIVKSFDKNLIETDIFETERINGAPLFNIEGEFLGLAFSLKGKVFAIPVTKIREFSGL